MPTIKPIRFKRLRSDAKVGNAERWIEQNLGLPKGSVRLVAPSGRKIRSDANVDRLRHHWR